MNAMEFRNVRLELGGRLILAGVSLDIVAREFVGVLGPNGAGKTTLMRAVLGLVPVTCGAIRVLGQPAARGNPAVGYELNSILGVIDRVLYLGCGKQPSTRWTK